MGGMDIDSGMGGMDIDSGMAGTDADMEPTEDMGPMMPTDSDNDNVTNDADLCADTPAGVDVDDNGCADSQLDTDGDGVTNDIDQCVTQLGGNVDAVGCCVTVLSDEIDSELPENPTQVNSNGSFVLSSRMFFDAPLISPIFELGTWNGMVVTENQTDLIFTFLNQDTDNRNDSFIGFAYDDLSGNLNVYRTNRSSLMNHHLTGITFYAFSGPIVENLQYDPAPGSTGLTLDGCGEVSHLTFQKVERLMNTMFPSE